jgi:PAS domain-containing protein
MKTFAEIEHAFVSCTDTVYAYDLMARVKENPDAFVSLHSKEGNYLAVSESVTAMLKYQPQDLIGHSAYDFFLADDFKAIMDSHAQVTVQYDVTTVSYRIRGKDGLYKSVTSKSKSILNRALDTHQILVLTYLQV